MLHIKQWNLLSAEERQLCLKRNLDAASIEKVVSGIVQTVRRNGDKALLEFTQQFDNAALQQVQITEETIKAAAIEPAVYQAIEQAIEQIRVVHQAQLPEQKALTTTVGLRIETVYRPIQRVGLYVPGGNKAPLVSSLLMQAVPAQVAGCPLRIFCTPPNAQGQVDPHLLVAAGLCGIEQIYAIGGAQAIAAMAYGTESVNKVDKIFGPGNAYVTEAKIQVASDPLGAAIDIPAGPSEVMILADSDANPVFIAADLLAQAEHGTDSQVILICDDPKLATQVNHELSRQFNYLSRQNIMSQSLAGSCIIICSDIEEQIKIVNAYAPEHLIINRQDGNDLVDKIKVAGTIFLGPWAAETMGDYMTGSNHVLPTNGFAKNHSGLGTLDFLTRFNVQKIEREAIINLGPAAMTLAAIEGLDAHANAIQVRLDYLET